MYPLEYLHLVFSNHYVILGAMICAILCKLFLFIACASIHRRLQQNETRILTALLMIFLAAAALDDLFYITSLIVRKILEIKGFIPSFTFLFRISWIFFTTQHQSLALFFLFLTNKKRSFSLWYLPHLLFNCYLTGGFIYLAFFNYYVPSSSPETLPFEISLIEAGLIYLPILFIPVFSIVIARMRASGFPLIVAHQLRYLLAIFVPSLFFELVNNPNSYLASLLPMFVAHKYTFFTVMTFLFSIGMYLVAKKLVGLRFLNLYKNIQSKEKFGFLEQFKDILEQLNSAEGLREVAYPVQGFFQAAFDIPIKFTHLVIRKNMIEKGKTAQFHGEDTEIAASVEQLLADDNKALIDLLREAKICIRDDVHFTQFYEEDVLSTEILKFLDVINADIFLPIFERNSCVAYIIIERNARANKLFTNKERDEMLIFTSYLSNIINVLKHSNVELLHQRVKELNEQLYQKHQENSQFKESLRSFMRSEGERKIGVVFFKRKFTLANDVAYDLIQIDLNTMEGHPLTQAFKSVAHLVQQYKTSQSTFAHDVNGQRVVISGLLGQDGFSVILHIYYPEVSDVVQSLSNKLKDPTRWDYLLYLETTKSGQIVNSLIPGSTEKILNFKIQLLSTALSKKATFLDLPEKDLMPTVELLHSISLRQTLHVLKLIDPEKNDDIAITLFGLNPLIKKDVPALLEKLDNGTCFIQNVELLALETQEALAHFIACGFFHRFKSDQKVFSAARIICSSTKNLETLVAQGKFSQLLYDELHATSLKMPSLLDLTDEEIDALAQGFAQQMITSDTYKNLLNLTAKDKARLIAERPLSLHDFKERVHMFLTQKSTQHNIQAVSEFNPAYHGADTDIAHAVRLGKKALRDNQIMTMLWNKFKNQSKIATLLGVNRSTVHRWCQEFNLK